MVQTLEDYLLQGYKLYILADSEKQHKRLREILDAQPGVSGSSVAANIPFESVGKTLHEGFVDHQLHACFFTDHQIFDRFHKYSLRSEKARAGKMALTMKELQEMEPGDFIVHVDFLVVDAHGVGVAFARGEVVVEVDVGVAVGTVRRRLHLKNLELLFQYLRLNLYKINPPFLLLHQTFPLQFSDILYLLNLSMRLLINHQ